MDAPALIRLLGLKPLPVEGGYFVETWRSPETMAAGALPARYGADRSFGTAIYYLLTEQTRSLMHRVKSDEVFHFYRGDPVELLLLHPGGRGERVVLGTDLAAGQRPQVVVPHGVWQGARLVPGGGCALLGTTVSPGFEYADFELGQAEALAAGWPQEAELVRLLAPLPAS